MVASKKQQKRPTTHRVVNNPASVNGDFAERERKFLAEFPDDRACLDHVLQKRFGDRFDCPKCRRTGGFHKIRNIPAFACQWCGYHLHPMAHTRFARSRVGLRTWFHAALLYTRVNNGISARELQRRLGLTYKTAWRIRNTIVEAKMSIRGKASNGGAVDFEELLDVLLTPSPSTKIKRPRKAA